MNENKETKAIEEKLLLFLLCSLFLCFFLSSHFFTSNLIESEKNALFKNSSVKKERGKKKKIFKKISRREKQERATGQVFQPSQIQFPDLLTF